MHDQREIFQTVHGMNRCRHVGQLLYRAFIAPILHEKAPAGRMNFGPLVGGLSDILGRRRSRLS
jgi:hypothetical protein